jgi:uncharacterized repeat protein (TIGR01451 family)
MKKIIALVAIMLMIVSTFATLASVKAVFASTGTGGPDSFGYTYIDNSVSGGPNYNWVEITGTGTAVLTSSDDSYVSDIPLGFFFNYYGTDYSQLTIGNNGLLFSNFGSSQYVNQPITGTPGLDGFIAPFWDDLVTWGSAGDIYYQTLGTAPNRMFVVQWQDNQHYSSSTSGVTFEAILYEGSNNILFQYYDLDFGTVYGSTGSDLPPYNNGGSATVGIESPAGNVGLQYSYNQQVINPGLAILFKFPAFSGTNMFLSKDAPGNMDHGNTMTYTVFYNNFGGDAAANVILQDTLPSSVTYVSASDGGTYDSTTRIVTWDIGSVPAFPSGHGTRTVTVTIPSSVPVGTVIVNTASISTTTLETTYTDNSASAQTTVTGSTLPPNTSVGPTLGNSGGEPVVYWGTPVTFTYYDAAAISVDIRIHINDGDADIVDFMTGPSPTWTYTVTFYPRHGEATVTYTPHYAGGLTDTIGFNIYIDPAGYVYDVNTNARIQGATVWLQRPDGTGDWENVPTGQSPAVMQPDTNPLTTDINGQYQWDTLAGTYRVHVEAPGYYSANSIVVSVPPPVFDLNVGLTHMPHPPTASFTESQHTASVNTPISFDPSGSSDTYDAIVLYEWDWTSDGIYDESYTAPTVVTHAFASVGTYTVTLRVTDAAGNTDTESAVKTITLVGADAASVWTTNNLGDSKSQFNLGETVFIYWNPAPLGSVVDIKVVDSTNTVIAGPWLSQPVSNAPLSFVPPGPGVYSVLVNGQPAWTIAVATLFVVPESILGTLMATVAGFAAFATLGIVKRKHAKSK